MKNPELPINITLCLPFAFFPYYYTGFKGKFTVLGLPYVRMGDEVQLVDPVLPERNGFFKVRGVEYTGGKGGNHQTIELDYKILI